MWATNKGTIKARVTMASTGNLTLVAAWYPHPGYNPKYPDEQYYRNRVAEFLARIHTPLVIFTSSSENDLPQSVRPSKAPMLLNNSFESIWDVPYLIELTHSFHTDQVKLADYFFWNDAAGMLPQKGNLTFWPDITRIRKAVPTDIGHPERLLMVGRELQPLRPVHASRELAPFTRTISAHFFGGTKGSIKWFSQVYYEMLAYYHSINQFVGSSLDHMYYYFLCNYVLLSSLGSMQF
ncbi:hypothetical protein COCC4DRAFT_148756 [Bipolaris maydis ATCC 48331]|uniref:Uncharacterized protein n=2 Tax=Cochliobolus heterostrophus TaxID=5016 RepID=M2ULB4_COCH5|nr:uncharacterized protein COCC4DRAFT_148756 [Bipolaris maydis ATCC 48331]EMD94386.1 hypothetical protein COCHEDRAFT_1153671 [Bipolaris maydis C5]ENI01274.1 hypothetical protein COCC4DRAFT_148756 [Bipolaris maydis ATCC 48331]KAJ6209811.1 hypothetical protein PSV09DRAFT_1153671 [Bipolaris maydis]